jgi:hypothetical protein
MSANDQHMTDQERATLDRLSEFKRNADQLARELEVERARAAGLLAELERVNAAYEAAVEEILAAHIAGQRVAVVWHPKGSELPNGGLVLMRVAAAKVGQ